MGVMPVPPAMKKMREIFVVVWVLLKRVFEVEIRPQGEQENLLKGPQMSILSPTYNFYRWGVSWPPFGYRAFQFGLYIFSNSSIFLVNSIVYIVDKIIARRNRRIILHYFLAFRKVIRRYISNNPKVLTHFQRELRPIKFELIQIAIMINFLLLNNLKFRFYRLY